MELTGGLAAVSLVCAVFLILYKCNKSVKYYTKFMFYGSFAMISGALCIPYFCIRAKNVENFLIFAETFKSITKVLGIRWTLRGREHLSRNKAFIIVANHQSCLDILGMLNIWNAIRLMTIIAKKELFYAGPFGIAAYLCGVIYIDRRSSKAKEVMNNAMEKLKKENIKLWIFPEGTRRNTGEIHDFKKGAFHTAIQYQIPIVPVVFSSYKHFLDNKQHKFEDGEMIISALPEISTEGLTSDDVNSLIETTKQHMTTVYKEISEEVAISQDKRQE